MMTSRADIIGKPGFYLDRSGTGTGKSTADIEAVRQVESALIISVTHENTKEIETDMQAAGLDAMKFPARRTDGDEINCWNGSADIAEKMGLSVVAAVCAVCPVHLRCSKGGGYLHQIAAVKSARIAIATQQRGVYNGVDKLASGRGEYVAIHEDSSGVLCPDEIVSLDDVRSAATVVDLILNAPKYLDWLGQSARKDEDGNWVPDEKLEERRNRIDEFVRHLADVIDALIADSETVEKTRSAEIPMPIKKATGTDTLLLIATLETEAKFRGAAWRALLAAAGGELHSIGWIVDETPRGKKTELIANWRNIPSRDAVTLFCDATGNSEELELYLGQPVIDITPTGYIARSKRVVQYPRDINRRTKPNAVLAMLRGVMSNFPESRRVGIITHRTIVGHLKQIGETFASRIVKSTYFGSGSDRASNDWYTQCDLIIVAGTPRVPSIAVQRRLIQFGDFTAAGENPDWGKVCWRGQTESGDEVVVTNRGYRHPLWMRAHRSVVRAALVQAVGRGRPILEAGCDVAIISTEECGFPLVDQGESRITQTELKLLSVIRELTVEKLSTRELTAICAYSNSKSRPPLTSGESSFQPLAETPEVARVIGLSDRQTRMILSSLEARGLVTRNGNRGGRVLTDAGRALFVEGAQIKPAKSAGRP